jgi:hypothetical protein
MAAKPPLNLDIVTRAASGAEAILASDSRSPGNRPQNLSFQTRRGEGFSSGGATFMHDGRLDRADLQLLSDVAFVGHDGSVAFEGILNSVPRTFDPGGNTISPNWVGAMILAQDEPFSEVFVDRQFSGWGDMPLDRKAALATGAIDFGSLSWSSDAGGLVCALPNQALGAQTIAETWYTAPSGVTIAKASYVGTDTSLPAGWEAPKLYDAADDAAASVDANSATFDSTLRSLTLANARRLLFWREYSNGTASTPAAGASRRLSRIAVYGNHGITTRTNPTSGEPDGLYLSDIVVNVAQRFCPQLDTSGVEDNTTLIEQAVYEDTTRSTPGRTSTSTRSGSSRSGRTRRSTTARPT